MARAHFVKKARKAIKDGGIKKGDSYYWWKFRYGGKRVSKTPPKQSQLTQSDFWGAVYSAQESASDVPDFESLASSRDDLVAEFQNIEDETQGKFDNMPENLQMGDTGQMIEERVSAIQEVISELEGIDCEPDIDENEGAEENETDEAKQERIDKLREEKAQEVWDEVTSALENISCS
jgi:hypothetical protein